MATDQGHDHPSVADDSRQQPPTRRGRALSLGQFIKGRRQKKGFTQQQVADFCRVTGVHISQIERGQRFPAAPLCLKLADILDFDPRDLARRAPTARSLEVARAARVLFERSDVPEIKTPEPQGSPQLQEFHDWLKDLDQSWPEERFAQLLETLFKMVECASILAQDHRTR